MLLAVIVHRTVRSLPTKYSVIFDDISHHTPYSYTDTQTQQHCVQCGAVHHSVFAMYVRISGKALKLPTECESFILNCSKIGCIRCEGESLQECSTTERNAVPVNGTISSTDTHTHTHTCIHMLYTTTTTTTTQHIKHSRPERTDGLSGHGRVHSTTMK